MRGRQCDPERPAACQHHHGARRARALRQIFGMAGKWNIRLQKNALLQGRGDQRIEFSAERAIDCAVKQRQYIMTIGRVQLAWRTARTQRLMLACSAPSPRTVKCTSGHSTQAACTACTLSSGPMPAGSPVVIAIFNAQNDTGTIYRT